MEDDPKISECTELISKLQFTEACSVFDALNGADFKRVVTNTFRSSSEGFRKILEFSEILKDDSRALALCQKLFDISFHEKFNVTEDYEFMYTCLGKRTNAEWIPLKNKILDLIVYQVINRIRYHYTWDCDISLEDIERIYNLDQKSGLRLMSYFTSDKYTNKNRYYSCLTRCPNINLVLQSLRTAMEMIRQKDSDEQNQYLCDVAGILRVAYGLDGSGVANKAELDRLRETLPGCIRLVVWSHHVRIRNKGSGNYLTVANRDGKWNIVTSPDKTDDCGVWKFTRDDDGRLVNVHLDQNATMHYFETGDEEGFEDYD